MVEFGRPPVPAELVHRLAEPRARLAERQWRHRRLVRRIGGIAGQPRDAHHAVVLGEERLQRGVVDRPVVGDAVERAHLEVGRVHARKMRGVHDGAAADAVEIDHLDRRVGVVDRIVGRPRAAVGIDGEIAEQARLPVPAVAGIVRRFHPVALLQADDPHPGIGQTPGHRGARCPGTDDQDIDFIKHRFFLPAISLDSQFASACQHARQHGCGVAMVASARSGIGSGYRGGLAWLTACAMAQTHLMNATCSWSAPVRPACRRPSPQAMAASRSSSSRRSRVSAAPRRAPAAGSGYPERRWRAPGASTKARIRREPICAMRPATVLMRRGSMRF